MVNTYLTLFLIALTALLPLTAHTQSTFKNSGEHSAILHDVPFIAQAPLGRWNDLRQEHGCEEASVLMAIAWARNKTFTKQTAERAIITLSNTEEKLYGSYKDTSLTDTVERLFKHYYTFNDVEVRFNITTKDIIQELGRGNIVLIQVNGRILKNPFYTPPGPIEHMLVIKGYDVKAKKFITNDPGTRHGNNYRYTEQAIQKALFLYPTTGKRLDTDKKTGMIVVSKKK